MRRISCCVTAEEEEENNNYNDDDDDVDVNEYTLLAKSCMFLCVSATKK